MALYIPPIMTLPVSRGGDLIVDFMRKVDGVYTDYDPGVTVRLEIDILPPGAGRSFALAQTVTGTAVITSFHAVCKIESTVSDTITENSVWRCVISWPTTPQSTEVVGVNGTIKRYDGI